MYTTLSLLQLCWLSLPVNRTSWMPLLVSMPTRRRQSRAARPSGSPHTFSTTTFSCTMWRRETELCEQSVEQGIPYTVGEISTLLCTILQYNCGRKWAASEANLSNFHSIYIYILLYIYFRPYVRTLCHKYFHIILNICPTWTLKGQGRE